MVQKNLFFFFLLLTVSCASYQEKMEKYKVTSETPYIGPKYLSSEKYAKYKEVMCGDHSEKWCQWEFRKQFANKLTFHYHVTMDQLGQVCAANEVECAKPEFLEVVARVKHNEYIDNMVRDYQTQSNINGLNAMSNAFGNVQQQMQYNQRNVKTCTTQFIGNTAYENCR